MGVFSSLFSDYKKLSTGAGRYAGEFDAWQPIKSYAREEEVAGTGRPSVPPILADVPFTALPPMQHFFQDIAKRVWKAAKPSMVQKLMFERKAFLGTHRPMGPERAPRPHLVSPSGMQVPGSIVEPTQEYLQGVAKDWELARELHRTNAYTFRGDGREPHVVMKAGGFHPPSSRTDENYLKNTIYELFIGYMARRFGAPPNFVSQDTFAMAVKSAIPSPEDRKWWTEYVLWRAMEDQEKFHPGRMVAYEALKGYISTSRSVSKAKEFALGGGRDAGWVYVMLVEGGIVIPEQGEHVWAKFDEQEIAYPGSIPWEKIYGFRQVSRAAGGKFVPNQPLLLRKGFQEKDPKAFKECYAVLSGKPQ